MCGIYGATIDYSRAQIEQKLLRTQFRGPDKMGIEVYKIEGSLLALGHNRLSIIDLDSRSNQPFTYLNRLHIVFNGEIYNFQSLKLQLSRKGYEFKTSSDTEVICAAYLEYGEDCVSHFNGMFAFVIYDEKTQLLFGARDRLGQKPLYYYHNGKDFEFASQISSIQLFHKNLSISLESINLYFRLGNIPDPYSIFNEVKKLKAGFSFVYNIHSGNFKVKQYWDIPQKSNNLFTGSYKEAKEQLSLLLMDAVKLRLFADVPLGVFLSGGIDSSLITTLATKVCDSKINTFSVKFNESSFDESKYALKVAERLGTNHTEIECSFNEGQDMIQNFNYYYDEPFADSSAIPSMLLAKYTKQNVTVALSGDAGDESFLGYQRYDWAKYGEMAMHFPYFFRRFAADMLAIVPNYRFKILSNYLKLPNVNTAYLNSMTQTSLPVSFNHSPIRIEEEKYIFNKNKPLLERISDFDLKTYLNWDINTKVDRASMAYSLEVRSPFLDYRIVEFAKSLPVAFKYKNGNKKHILKDLLYEDLPKEIFHRPKSGFTMPFSHWFRNSLKDYVLDELNENGLKAIPNLNVKETQEIIQQHMDGSWNRYPMIWSLLVLKQWLSDNGKGISIK